MLILSLLVSHLILVYSLIVTSHSYVDKLTPVAHSSVFKNLTSLDLKSYYDYNSINTRSYIGLSTYSTVLVHHMIIYWPNLLYYYISFVNTFPLVLYFLQYYPSMITRLYFIHGHVRISHANLPGTYTSLIHSLESSLMMYIRMVFPLTLSWYVDVIIQIWNRLQTYISDLTLLVHP